MPSQDVLSALYATIGDREAWSRFLTRLALFLDRPVATLSLYDAASVAGCVEAQHGLEPESVDAFLRHYAAINPWMAQPDRRPVGRVVDTNDIVDRSQLVLTEWYNDFCRTICVSNAVGVTVEQSGSRSIVLSVMGLDMAPQQRRTVIDTLGTLVPHLLRAAQLNRQFADLQVRAWASDYALSQLGTAVFLVDADAAVTFQNSAASVLLSQDDGLIVAGRALGARSAADLVNLRSLIASASRSIADSSDPGGVTRVSRRSGRPAYDVLVTPINPETLGRSLQDVRAAVFVRDPDTRSVAPLEQLQRLHGLTKAEARVMGGLLAGLSLAAMSERFGVTQGTLRLQLKALFRKTGTSGQSELLRLGLRGVASFPQ